MDEIKNSYENFNSQILTYSDKNNYQNKDSKEIIDFVHDNISNINNNNINIIQDILLKILPLHKIEQECLTFDLLNYSSSNNLETIDAVIDTCILALKKYQYKVGGYNIEDLEWIIGDKNNNRFKVKDKQKILYNSIHKKNCDKELIWFLDSILEYVKRHTNNEKIKVKYSVFEDERNCVCWIIYKFSEI